MTAGSGTLNWTDNSPRGRTPGSMPVNPPNLDGWDAWCEACATHRPPQLHEGARSKEWRGLLRLCMLGVLYHRSEHSSEQPSRARETAAGYAAELGFRSRPRLQRLLSTPRCRYAKVRKFGGPR